MRLATKEKRDYNICMDCLIQSGGGTGPMKPGNRQMFARCQILRGKPRKMRRGQADKTPRGGVIFLKKKKKEAEHG